MHPEEPDESEEAPEEEFADISDEDLIEDAALDAEDSDGPDEGEGGDEVPDGAGGSGEAEGLEAPVALSAAARKAKEEEEEEILFAKNKVPSKTVLRSALDWAFENENVPEGFLDICAEHALLVLDAARRMNLTKIVEPKEVAAKHYLDCWRMAEQLPLMGRRVLDIGSGAGFPGIPTALAEPNASVVLIDSTKKKADFIAETIEKLGIKNATAIWGRAEEHLLTERYNTVVMRAISSVRENVRLLRKVRHSLHDLVMMKGSSWSREVRAGEREAERLGFRLDTILEHELPGEMGGRAVLVYRAPGGQGR